MPYNNNTTLDRLFEGRLEVLQSREGYRFSIDSILLGLFAREKASGRVAELGTGNGVIALILAKKEKIVHVTGIEIQKELSELANRNVEMNRLCDKIEIVNSNIIEIKKDFQAECFSSVVTNPPFYSPESGLINPDSESAIARHEIHGKLCDFVAAAGFLLKYSGLLFMIYLASRLADLLVTMRQHGIEPKSVQFIHPKKTEAAVMVLVQGKKGAKPGLRIKEPVFIHDNSGNYSDYIKNIFEKV